jgi:hypothetical protein
VAGQEHGAVIGTVLGTDGKPIGGVCVTAIPADPTQPIGPAAVTSRSGIFAISGLSAGAYDLMYRSCAGSASRIGFPGRAAERSGKGLAARTLSRVVVTGGRAVRASAVVLRTESAGPVVTAMPAPSERRLTLAGLRARASGANWGGVSGTVTGPRRRPMAKG